MAVFRIERTRDYTVMSNHHLRDKALSLKSKGLLSMMLSLPEDWNYTTRGLAKICKEGVDAIGGALRELEAAGYIVRHQMRDRQGRISDTEYVIYEQPQPKEPDTPQPDTASPDTENPYLADPDTEKPAELNIEKSKTQKQTTDVPSTDSIPFRGFAAAQLPERKGRDAMSVEEMESYAAKEAALQAEIDNIESSHPGYDEYRYDLDMIGHDPHELAAYLSAVLQGYTRASAQAELERIFAAQYQLTLTEEVEVRYRTETRTDSEGNEYDVEVPYNYYILNVTLTSKPISSVASELLTPDQLEMYQVYRQTLGNKPLIFGGGSADTSDSESLAGVEFVNGTRPGNQAVVDIAKSQVGNVGGQPYWSWYGFTSRVEWCACFVSWCYGQMGLTEPRFSGCQSQGIPWFQSHGQWGGRDYANIAPGDAIFFDWDLDGSADHVGIVVGTDGSRVYTVEGNSGDACKIKSYSLTYECIKGYGLMNW